MRTQPNIILIYTDDLGYGDLGCYGSDLATPNLDGMAKEGVLFQQFCSASPVCSPARAALLTGRYPTRVGVPDVLQPADTCGLSLSESTLADTLKGAGYATMCIGKWHLGSQPQYMPTKRGFDQYYGLPYSNDMYPLPLMQNTTVIEQPAKLDTLTERYTDQAVSFISRSKDTPFFLYMPHTFPHIPLAASQRFLGKSGFGLYGDAVAEVDWSVGEVLRAVRTTASTRTRWSCFRAITDPGLREAPAGCTGTRGRRGKAACGSHSSPVSRGRFPPAGCVRAWRPPWTSCPQWPACAAQPCPPRRWTATISGLCCRRSRISPTGKRSSISIPGICSALAWDRGSYIWRVATLRRGSLFLSMADRTCSSRIPSSTIWKPIQRKATTRPAKIRRSWRRSARASKGCSHVSGAGADAVEEYHAGCGGLLPVGRLAERAGIIGDILGLGASPAAADPTRSFPPHGSGTLPDFG